MSVELSQLIAWSGELGVPIPEYKSSHQAENPDAKRGAETVTEHESGATSAAHEPQRAEADPVAAEDEQRPPPDESEQPGDG